LVATLMVLCPAGAAQAAGGYAEAVAGTSGLIAYWRLGETSGMTATDVTGRAPGSLLGGVGLGARGALSGDADTAARFRSRSAASGPRKSCEDFALESGGEPPAAHFSLPRAAPGGRASTSRSREKDAAGHLFCRHSIRWRQWPEARSHWR